MEHESNLTQHNWMKEKKARKDGKNYVNTVTSGNKPSNG